MVRLYCNKCKSNAAKGAFCTKCGSKLVDLEAQQQGSDSTPTPSTSTNQSSSSPKPVNASPYRSSPPPSKSTSTSSSVSKSTSSSNLTPKVTEQPKVEEAPKEVEKPYRVFDYFKDAQKFLEFTTPEIEVFIKSFEEYDTDGNGSIDAKELEIAFKKMGQGCTPEMVRELIQEFDEDKSGEIEWNEFLQIMRSFYPDKRSQFENLYLKPAKKFPEFTNDELQVFIDVFREFDIDSSGTISSDELKPLLLAAGQGCSDEEIESFMEAADTDKNGEIDFEEYLYIMRGFYPHKKAEFEERFYGYAKKFPEFSRAEVDVFVANFREFDLDNSGTIDSSELALLFKHMGQGCSQDEIEELVHSTSSNGQLSWNQFFDIVVKYCYPDKKSEYEWHYFVPAKNFPEFTRNEIEVFVENFREYDLDNSDSIDVNELGRAFVMMGQGVSRQKLEEIIEREDDSGSGQISWTGFLRIMRMLYSDKYAEYEDQFYIPAKNFPEFSKDEIEVFIASFRECDIDGSGTIDVDELALVFKRMGQGCTREKLVRIVEVVDENGNGVIDWPEFLVIMKSLYPDRKPPAKKTATNPPSKNQSQSQQPQQQQQQFVGQSGLRKTPSSNTVNQNQSQNQNQNQNQNQTQTQNQEVKAPTPVKTSTPSTNSTSSTTSNTSSSSSNASGTKKCSACGKTVYPTDSMTAVNTVFHKGCFRCQEQGCGLTLNLKTFKGHGGKIYCNKHVPAYKATPQTQV